MVLGFAKVGMTGRGRARVLMSISILYVESSGQLCMRNMLYFLLVTRRGAQCAFFNIIVVCLELSVLLMVLTFKSVDRLCGRSFITTNVSDVVLLTIKLSSMDKANL